MTAARSVTAFAPGSVGNVVCGFDVLGLALGGPGDRVTAVRRDAAGVELRSITGDDGRLPRSSGRNSATVAVQALVDRVDPGAGVELELEKGLPLSAGMGGSAASAVAAVVAAADLLGVNATGEDLLACALEGERAASGSLHPDNVGPSLSGGIVLVRRQAARPLVPLPIPDGLSVALLHPPVELRTSEARSLLPETIPLEQAVAQWGDTAALAAGLFREDWELIGDAMNDRVAEPARSGRIPGFAAMKAAALEAGAVGFGISGAGPSVFALCRSLEVARGAAAAMAAAFPEPGEDGLDLHVCRVPGRGARIVERRKIEPA